MHVISSLKVAKSQNLCRTAPARAPGAETGARHRRSPVCISYCAIFHGEPSQRCPRPLRVGGRRLLRFFPPLSFSRDFARDVQHPPLDPDSISNARTPTLRKPQSWRNLPEEGHFGGSCLLIQYVVLSFCFLSISPLWQAATSFFSLPRKLVALRPELHYVVSEARAFSFDRF